MLRLPEGYKICPICNRGATKVSNVACPVCMKTMKPEDREALLDDQVHKRVEIVIEGNPVPKGRPKFNRKTGQVFTPQRTVDYEKHVAWSASMNCSRPIEGPVAVYIDAHVYKGDIDNFAKAILDGMNGIVYADDKQVEHLQVNIKRVGPRAGFAHVVVEAQS